MHRTQISLHCLHVALALIIALGLASPLSAAEKQRLYRWVDDKGQVYYSDKVPPEYADQEKAILNEQGLKVDAIEGAKTPEQLAEEQRLANIAAEAQRKRDEEIAHNRMLLSTFSTEDDLIMARDGKIAALDASIRVAKARIQSLEKSLEHLRANAAEMERNGRAVPDKLYQDIESTRQQIADNNKYIANMQAEQDTLRTRFEADLVRYRKLKGLDQANTKDAAAAAVDSTSTIKAATPTP